MEGDAFVRVAAESAEYNRTLVDVRPLYTVGRKQDDTRIPLRTVQAEVLAPFPQHGIVNNVRSPHVAIHGPWRFFSIGTGTGKGAVPSCGIEITEIHRFAVDGDFPRLVGVESVCRSYVDVIVPSVFTVPQGKDTPVQFCKSRVLAVAMWEPNM